MPHDPAAAESARPRASGFPAASAETTEAAGDSPRLPARSATARVRRLVGLLALPVALIGIAALYLPFEVLTGERQLYGSDFLQVHQYRLEYFREAIASGSARVPAWYSREALGTPFRADPQNFPWSPLRLPLLLFPPHAAYAPGILLAAVAALVATYLLATSLGVSRAGAAVAGFSFAASGMFASRVTAGHLPNLEGYAALPLLLFLAERAVTDEAGRARWIFAIGAATAAVALTGHPQFPAYAILLASVYLLWRAPRRAVRPLAAMVLGGATTLFCWWPGLLLAARSARALPLARPDNDVPFPYGRLKALFAPWRDGWPAAVDREPARPFAGYSSDAVFWETSSYVGLLPWLALAVLLVLVVLGRQRLSRPAVFLAGASVVCAVLALPLAQGPLSALPVLVFRSPARLLVVAVLSLALLLGATVDRLLGRKEGAWLLLALVLVAVHAADLVIHASPFVRTTVSQREPRPQIEEILARDAGASRVALDYNLPIAPTRRYDDVGFFSSLQLATTYRTLVALTGAPETTSDQYFSGARQLPAAALANLGVRYVASLTNRPDLRLLLVDGGVPLYEVARPVPRALFFPGKAVRYWHEPDMPELLAQPGVRLDQYLYLPLAQHEPAPESPRDGSVRPLRFVRPTPDTLEVELGAAEAPGYVRLLEAHDPGWRATVDGQPASVLRSEGLLLAVRVPAGAQRVHLRYRTPGAGTGFLLSTLALGAFVVLVRARP